MPNAGAGMITRLLRLYASIASEYRCQAETRGEVAIDTLSTTARSDWLPDTGATSRSRRSSKLFRSANGWQIALLVVYAYDPWA